MELLLQTSQIICGCCARQRLLLNISNCRLPSVITSWLNWLAWFVTVVSLNGMFGKMRKDRGRVTLSLDGADSRVRYMSHCNVIIYIHTTAMSTYCQQQQQDNPISIISEPWKHTCLQSYIYVKTIIQISFELYIKKRFE